MPKIKSKAKVDSNDFKENDVANRKLAAELKAVLAKISEGGSERARKKHLARGKLLPRDRIRSVVDRGAPFLEIGQLAAYGQYDDEVPAAGIIAGIGQVSDIDCVIVANDDIGGPVHLQEAHFIQEGIEKDNIVFAEIHTG